MLFSSLYFSSLLKFFIARENKFYARGLAEKKIYSIRGSQLRRVAQKPIRIRVPAMMDCRSYGKLSVKHNIDPRSLCPTPANSGFTLVAAVPPGGAFCNVGLPTHCHTNLSQPPPPLPRFRPLPPLFSFSPKSSTISRTTYLLLYKFFCLPENASQCGVCTTIVIFALIPEKY